MKFTSPERARSFCRRGLAEMIGARLYFFQDSPAQRSAEQEFARNRGGVLFWNGARAYYVNGQDLAMYPPGCNVLFRPPNWLRR